MNIRQNKVVVLSGDEVAQAIDAYLVAHGISVVGPRTIEISVEDCGMSYVGLTQGARVSANPPGKIVDNR